MIDIILINIPLIETSGPLLAPALLKSSLKAQNFSVKTIDFNIRFFNNNYTTEIDYFFRTNEGNDETRQTAESLVSTWVDETLAFISFLLILFVVLCLITSTTLENSGEFAKGTTASF